MAVEVAVAVTYAEEEVAVTYAEEEVEVAEHSGCIRSCSRQTKVLSEC